MDDATGIDQTINNWDDSDKFNFADHYFAPPAAKNYVSGARVSDGPVCDDDHVTVAINMFDQTNRYNPGLDEHTMAFQCSKACTVDKLVNLGKKNCGANSICDFSSGYVTKSFIVKENGECWCRHRSIDEITCHDEKIDGDWFQYNIKPNTQGTPYMYRNSLITEKDVAFSVQYDPVYTSSTGGPIEMEVADQVTSGTSNIYGQMDYSNLCKECPANKVAKWPSDNIEILWGGPVYGGENENCEACKVVSERIAGSVAANNEYYDGTRNLWWSHCHTARI